MKPRRIFLIRHGQSEGQVDKNLYQSKPDYAMRLTPLGVEQAETAGAKLKAIIGAESVALYTSPYFRTLDTMHCLCRHISVPFIRHDPRLREQEWSAKLRNDGAMETVQNERDAYGHFYYRFDSGESCADVYDRLSTFLDTLHRDFEKEDFPTNVIIVNHGMTMRVFLMRWFHYSVEQFEMLANPANCEIWQLDKTWLDKFRIMTNFKKYDEPKHPYQYVV